MLWPGRVIVYKGPHLNKFWAASLSKYRKHIHLQIIGYEVGKDNYVIQNDLHLAFH